MHTPSVNGRGENPPEMAEKPLTRLLLIPAWPLKFLDFLDSSQYNLSYRGNSAEIPQTRVDEGNHRQAFAVPSWRPYSDG